MPINSLYSRPAASTTQRGSDSRERNFVCSFPLQLHSELVLATTIWGFASLSQAAPLGEDTHPQGTGVRPVWTSVCVCVCVGVSVSNGAIKQPPRSIMRVPGHGPRGPQHTCTHLFKWPEPRTSTLSLGTFFSTCTSAWEHRNLKWQREDDDETANAPRRFETFCPAKHSQCLMKVPVVKDVETVPWVKDGRSLSASDC